MFEHILHVNQVKRGDIVTVYGPDGWADVAISRVSRIKGFVQVQFDDGYWERFFLFWVAGYRGDN